MYITFAKAINTCFGHVSFDDAPRVTDALSDLIDRAPTSAIARKLYFRSFGSEANAGRYLGRAWKRLGALAEALEARRGAHLSHEFGEATKGATLLIGADLAAAALIDPSSETLAKVFSILAIAFPEAELLDLYHEFEVGVVGSRQDADAISAISSKAFEREYPPVAAWYQRVIASPMPERVQVPGLLQDAAFVRHQLLAPLKGADSHALGELPSGRAFHASCIANAIGLQMTQREFTPHRAPIAA
jgi:hypothetical protein